jgi:transcriptional regulator with XRE-family HTH domain
LRDFQQKYVGNWMNRLQAIGAAIREARQERQLSQEKLAEHAKLHRNVIGLAERGVSAPALESLFAIADALEMPASKLVARAEELAADAAL